MKKIFTLIAVAAMALSANAQSVITFGDKDALVSMAESFKSGDLTIAITDTDGKFAIDANSQYFGDAENYVNYGARLKTGGKSSSKNFITATVAKDGKLTIAVRSASGSATDRNLVATQSGTELYNKVVKDEDAVKATIDEEEKNVFPLITIDVKAGDIELTYPNGSLNFYAFSFVAEGEVDAINNVKVAENANAPMYNLAGQQVGKNYKGVVIQNGVKRIQK